jgi:hypothetical protein
VYQPAPENLLAEIRQAAGNAVPGGHTEAVCHAAAARIEALEAKLLSYEKPEPLGFKPIDPLCEFRECCAPGEDKGTFSQGRGYTGYHGKARSCCLTNHLHGCPAPLPLVSPADVLDRHFGLIRASAKHGRRALNAIDAAHRAIAALFNQPESAKTSPLSTSAHV